MKYQFMSYWQLSEALFDLKMMEIGGTCTCYAVTLDLTIVYCSINVLWVKILNSHPFWSMVCLQKQRQEMNPKKMCVLKFSWFTVYCRCNVLT